MPCLKVVNGNGVLIEGTGTSTLTQALCWLQGKPGTSLEQRGKTGCDDLLLPASPGNQLLSGNTVPDQPCKQALPLPVACLQNVEWIERIYSHTRNSWVSRR